MTEEDETRDLEETDEREEELDLLDLPLDEAVEVKRSLDKLFESLGWAFVLKFLAMRVQGRERQLLSTCPADTKEFIAYARIKGQIEEAQLLPDMLKAVRDDLAMSIEMQRNDENQGES